MSESEVETDSELLWSPEPRGNRSVVLEDDGRVVYAYLRIDETIVGDVWVYNVAEHPDDDSELADPARLPFRNPRPYIDADGRLPRLVKADVIAVWGETEVQIWFGGTLVAELWAGARPGRSLLARRAGPLALPLE